MGLYGLTTTQAYLYWFNYPKDSWWTKLLVLFLWVLNTAHTVGVCHNCYYHLITAMFNLEMLLRNVWSLGMTVVIWIIVFATVMSYYIKMIFQLSSARFRWWLTGAMTIPFVLALGFGLDAAVRMFLAANVEVLLQFSQNTILPAFIMLVITDSFVTGFLCILLYRKRTEFKRTRHIVNTLIIYAASRGLVSTATSLTMALVLAIRPSTIWYSAAEFAIVGIYTNSLMTMLNTRRTVYEVADTGRSPADSMNKESHFGLTGRRRNQNGVSIANKAPNVEFIELGERGTNYKDVNQHEEDKPAV
ncbi:hypothetical protein SERLA73DRAFT_188712 [Serpula lacrymans var. lacrymans S7.3]|uniref:DUF6534 domain-containing protein n=2 Tax=Serpula lacrymans var. lacrymans TaxID=341189 RepID=F8QC07_SERL3|nr:uncharacterized protein SERLADRAFT_479112 [Serpula lacrymans var. lacrymans S7.9]EGN94126.1 hypothetical protein SERLA73DRAFT_188712 [Serpula lacrymans var. lacrymans S7.3]EGO19560.1 hypothetical protein SERLADRAFT_479112 [Serpula lacrymans var. lacrymans S7.9]